MLCLSVGGAEVGMVDCIGGQWARGGRIAVLSAKSGKRRGRWLGQASYLYLCGLLYMIPHRYVWID